MEDGVVDANVNNTNEMQQSQPIFPTSISSAVVCLIDLLNDYELNSNNQSSGWSCFSRGL